MRSLLLVLLLAGCSCSVPNPVHVVEGAAILAVCPGAHVERLARGEPEVVYPCWVPPHQDSGMWRPSPGGYMPCMNYGDNLVEALEKTGRYYSSDRSICAAWH